MMKALNTKSPLGVFFYAGFASMFAYNILLFELMELKTPIGVFEPNASRTPLARDYLITTYGGACNLGLILNILLVSKCLSANARIILGSVVSGLAVFAIAFFAEVFPLKINFGFLLLGVVSLFAVASSSLQGALGGVISTCPGSAITAFSVGQAAAGVPTLPLSWLLGIFTQSVNVRLVVEFGIAAVLLFGIFPVFRFCKGEAFVKEQVQIRSVSTAESVSDKAASKWSVIKHIWPQIAVVWLSMFVTFIGFPAHFLNWGLKLNLVKVRYLIWCFQIFDTLGRLSTFVIPMPKDAGIFVFTGLRVLLIPLIFLITYKIIPVLLHNLVCYAVAAVLGFTLALNLTWGLVRGAQRCDTGAEKVIAGLALTFALLNGIFVGSCLSNFVLENFDPSTTTN